MLFRSVKKKALLCKQIQVVLNVHLTYQEILEDQVYQLVPVVRRRRFLMEHPKNQWITTQMTNKFFFSDQFNIREILVVCVCVCVCVSPT